MVTPADLEKALAPVSDLWRQDELHILSEMGREARRKIIDDSPDDYLDYLIFEIIFGDLKKSAAAERKSWAYIREKLPPGGSTDDIVRDWSHVVHADVERLARQAQTGYYRIFQEAIEEARREIPRYGKEGALEDACEQIADNLKPVKDRIGDSPRERYLERLIAESFLTGMNRAAAEAELTAAREGSGLIEVSAHHGARPTHQVWQGRLYALDGPKEISGSIYPDFVESTGYGSGEGLCGWNCRHSFWHKPLGEPRRYTDEYLDHLKDIQITYDGDSYSEYELGQKLNYYRRQLRRWENRLEAKTGAAIGTDLEVDRVYTYEKEVSRIEKSLRSVR